MTNVDKILLTMRQSTALLSMMLIGSYVLSVAESYINIGNIYSESRKYHDSVNGITPFKTFVFAPIFETFLIYFYVRIADAKKSIFKYILWGICMGLFHEYYQPGSFLPILFVFFVMTYGLVDFLHKYERMVSIALIAVIHSLYNVIVVYFF